MRKLITKVLLHLFWLSLFIATPYICLYWLFPSFEDLHLAIQLLILLPVPLIGLYFFGRGIWRGIHEASTGVGPNQRLQLTGDARDGQ